MKIGYNEATSMKRSSLEKDLILCEKYNYDFIEIRIDMLERFLKKNKVYDLEVFFRNNKVKPYAFNAVEEINSYSNNRFKKMSEKLHRLCAISQRIGNPYIIVVPSFRDKLIIKLSKNERIDNSIEVLNKIADITEEYNIRIAFEPVGFNECAIQTIQDAWKIIKKIDRDSVGLTFDAFNVYVNGDLSDFDTLRLIDVNKLFVFHINDCEGSVQRKLLELKHRVWPGDGVIPLDKILNILYEIKFDKIASIELFNEEYWKMEPEDVIKIAKERVGRMIQNYYN